MLFLFPKQPACECLTRLSSPRALFRGNGPNFHDVQIRSSAKQNSGCVRVQNYFFFFFKTPIVTLQFIPISSPFSSARATLCTCHISKCWQQIYHLQLVKDYEIQICACVSVCWLRNYCVVKALFARSFISLKVQSLSSLPFSNTVTISSYKQTHTDAHL